jgi:hypothetical protein
MTLHADGPSYEELTQLMGVFSGDKDLMNWFVTLQDMNETARCSHLRTMADGMRMIRERPDLIAAVESLISPRVFASAIRTVESLGK